MSRIEDSKVDLSADGPVGSVGGRGPSMLSTGQLVAPRVGLLAPGQRWSVTRKREVVLRLMRGEPTELLSCELGAPLYRLARWRERAQATIGDALKEREADGKSIELAAAMQRIGDLSME